MSDQVVDFFGMQYEVPVVSHWQGTVIAVNVGGAVIPTLMSLYLLFKRDLWVKGADRDRDRRLVLHWLANPVPGLGIAVPVFVPVVTTAAVALLLSRQDAAPLAYIAGSLGTLIGADLTNLDKVRGLGAPVASIGGAGTFDGIFLTGILAVLIANLYAGPRQVQMRIATNTPRLEPRCQSAPVDAITDYHAHVYYDPANSRDRAERLRERVAAAFPQAKLGRWHDELVGPHPQSMYQIAFPTEMLAAFVPWLMLNRDGLTILLHPETGDDLHRSHRACSLVRRGAAAAARGVQKVIRRTPRICSRTAVERVGCAMPRRPWRSHCTCCTGIALAAACCDCTDMCCPNGLGVCGAPRQPLFPQMLPPSRNRRLRLPPISLQVNLRQSRRRSAAAVARGNATRPRVTNLIALCALPGKG